MLFSYFQIGAKDYRALADFYAKALDFTVSDDTSWLNGREGIELSAPGFADMKAPVLGIVKATEGAARNINDVGFAHLCFETVDVKAAVWRFKRCGGTILSTLKHPEKNPCVYCRDPEGNIVEFHIPFPSLGMLTEYIATAGSLLGLRYDRGLRSGGKSDSLKFIHVNIITEDWQKLCGFYRDAFGCTDTGSIKDHSGDYKSKVIGIENVHVLGRHILLPGFFSSYPTLEIFTYSVKGLSAPQSENELGINCIGFLSENMAEDVKLIEDCGGRICSSSETAVLAQDIQGGCITLRPAEK